MWILHSLPAITDSVFLSVLRPVSWTFLWDLVKSSRSPPPLLSSLRPSLRNNGSSPVLSNLSIYLDPYSHAAVYILGATPHLFFYRCINLSPRYPSFMVLLQSVLPRLRLFLTSDFWFGSFLRYFDLCISVSPPCLKPSSLLWPTCLAVSCVIGNT